MIAGRYELVREIGRGGMGAVHLARDQVLGREVAIKRIGLLPGADDPDLARAEREARIAAMLHHPNVVSVFDLVEEDERHWLVMEYVPGTSLSQRVRDRGPMDHATAAAVMAQVADALTAAHAAGITHRDVKPSNVLVADDDTAKLGDFGIARKAADASLTQTGLVTGSPAYLAPEIASGSTAGAASDVWSLGATLFHVLSGRPPYDVGENLIGGLYQIVHEEPPRLANAGAFDEVLRSTMARDPQQRWSMVRVRDRLREIAELPAAVGVMSTETASTDGEPMTEVLAPLGAGAATSDPRGSADSDQLDSSLARAERTSAPADERGHSSAKWWWAAATALLLLGLVAGIAWLTYRPDDPATKPATPPSSPTTSESDPSPSVTTTEPVTPAKTERDMVDFINEYMVLVTTNPQAAFARLTPEFQAESGGYSGYTNWWSRIASARADNITVDPKALRVEYDAVYETNQGRQTGGHINLKLKRVGDGYLIAGEG